MVTVWTEKNITRIVNHHRCCQGYEPQDGRCIPVCEERCLHGTCVEPNVSSILSDSEILIFISIKGKLL